MSMITDRRAAAQRYLDACRSRIPPFVARHFSLRGTLALHQAALWSDLWRAPLNTLLAVPAFFVHLAAHLLRRTRLKSLPTWLERLQLGVPTTLEREIERLILTEILALPVAFRQNLTETAPLSQLVRRYARTRSAASELTVNVLLLCIGALVFHQLTPGSLSAGAVIAGALAERAAIEAFPLGAWAGEAFYAVFPLSWSLADIGIAVIVTLAAVTLLSTSVGILADPLQTALGIHRRRLERLVDALERRILGQGPDFNPKDAYFARLVDLVDAARAAGTLLP